VHRVLIGSKTNAKDSALPTEIERARSNMHTLYTTGFGAQNYLRPFEGPL
jgi:hypothetical protein